VEELVKKYWIFIVDDNTWPEHLKAGVAAVNEPPAEYQKQSAIAETIGVRPGDYIFFNIRVSEAHPPQIVGLFEATTEPYYDPNPLYNGARFIGVREPYLNPYRVGFKQVVNLPVPINVDEIWYLKERGLIWSIQHSRGDAVGTHACTTISLHEGRLIEKMLKARNPIIGKLHPTPNPPSSRRQLPINTSLDREGNLHYEHALKALIVKDLAKGLHKEILGDYDDYIPNLPTGARKEVDVLLLKYNEQDVIWYEILELKKAVFNMDGLQELLKYEKWFIQTRALSPLQVHPIAIAYKFDVKVKEYAKRRNIEDKPLRLIKYRYDPSKDKLILEEEGEDYSSIEKFI
jgi:predicted RNA-binding protein